MGVIEELKNDLKKYVKQDKTNTYSKFFKTGKGDYAEGDIFIGVIVPDIRKVAKKYYKEISLSQMISLLQSNIHEYKLLSLFLLIHKYDISEDENSKKDIVDLYIKNLEHVNNWDLVDMSAHKIIGDYLYNFNKDRKILYDFANSNHLWTQRISILSTFYFIRNNDFDDTLSIAEILLEHKHDLIHKAVGWMLREVGKRDFDKEFVFLKKNYKRMPRTMLRYAIEKFDLELRKNFLKDLI